MLKCITYIISYFILLSTYAFGNLIRPENGAELSYIHVLFQWEEVENTNSFEFLLLDQNSNIIFDCESTYHRAFFGGRSGKSKSSKNTKFTKNSICGLQGLYPLKFA